MITGSLYPTEAGIMIPFIIVTLRFAAHDGRYARLYRTISPVCNVRPPGRSPPFSPAADPGKTEADSRKKKRRIVFIIFPFSKRIYGSNRPPKPSNGFSVWNQFTGRW